MREGLAADVKAGRVELRRVGVRQDWAGAGRSASEMLFGRSPHLAGQRGLCGGQTSLSAGVGFAAPSASSPSAPLRGSGGGGDAPAVAFLLLLSPRSGLLAAPAAGA